MKNLDKLYLKGEIIIALVNMLEELETNKPDALKRFSQQLDVILKIK